MSEKNNQMYKGMLDLEEDLRDKNIKTKSGDITLYENPYKRTRKRNKPFRDKTKRHDFNKFMK